MHKFRLRFVIAALVLISLLTVGYFLYMEEQGNFHPITEGEVYRSAQLDRDVLDYYIKKYNIKSIINLMVPGTNKGKCRAQNGTL